MFHISRKADYAIRGMIFLACKQEGQMASIKDIAGFAETSQTFLAKIFQHFGKTGIVRSYRGAGGGFLLGRPARDISLLDIVEAVDGPILVNSCILGRGACSRDETCPAHPVWKRIQQEIREMLRKVTLECLIETMPEKPGQSLSPDKQQSKRR